MLTSDTFRIELVSLDCLPDVIQISSWGSHGLDVVARPEKSERPVVSGKRNLCSSSVDCEQHDIAIRKLERIRYWNEPEVRPRPPALQKIRRLGPAARDDGFQKLSRGTMCDDSRALGYPIPYAGYVRPRKIGCDDDYRMSSRE